MLPLASRGRRREGTETMHGYGTQRQYQAPAAVARVRAAFACAMPASSWSTMSNLDVTTIDHKPGRPRRLRVNSP